MSLLLGTRCPWEEQKIPRTRYTYRGHKERTRGSRSQSPSFCPQENHDITRYASNVITCYRLRSNLRLAVKISRHVLSCLNGGFLSFFKSESDSYRYGHTTHATIPSSILHTFGHARKSIPVVNLLRWRLISWCVQQYIYILSQRFQNRT